MLSTNTDFCLHVFYFGNFQHKVKSFLFTCVCITYWLMLKEYFSGRASCAVTSFRVSVKQIFNIRPMLQSRMRQILYRIEVKVVALLFTNSPLVFLHDEMPLCKCSVTSVSNGKQSKAMLCIQGAKQGSCTFLTPANGSWVYVALEDIPKRW